MITDYNKLYSETEKYLQKIAAQHGINTIALQKYFIPNHKQLPYQNGKDIRSVFLRICFHSQNRTIMRDIIRYDSNYPIIKKI